MNNIAKTFRTENNSIVAEGTTIRVNPNATLEDWKSFGEMLKKAENHVQWYLGYWWNYGHKKWSRDAEEFINELGYKRSTVQKYGQIYNAVKPGIRIPHLTFRHHQNVAPLPPEKQEFYLNKAAKEGLSSPKLREVIRQAERPSEQKKESTPKHYLTEKRLTALKEHLDKIIELLNVKVGIHAPIKHVRFELGQLKEELNKLDTYC